MSLLFGVEKSVKKIDVSALRRYLEVRRSKRVPQGAQTDFFYSRDRLRRKGGNAHSLGSFPLFPQTGVIRTNCCLKLIRTIRDNDPTKVTTYY